MTRKRIKEILPIIQAYAEGKDIQYRLPGSTESWKTFIEDKCTSPFNHDHWEYRIKPEPREFWVVVDGFNGRALAVFDNPDTITNTITNTHRTIKVVEVL